MGSHWQCLTGLARLVLEEMGAKGMAGDRFRLQTYPGPSLLLCPMVPGEASSIVCPSVCK